MANGFDNAGFVSNLENNLLSNFSGIVSSRPQAKFASGARCVLKVNGNLIGFAFSISWRIDTQQTEINTIDEYVPYEYAPQRVTVEGTIGALHIPGQGSSVKLIQSDILSFLYHKYITIEVRDSRTDDLLFFTNHAVITSRAEEYRVDQLGSVTLNWKAIGWSDERSPQDISQTNSTRQSTTVPPGTSLPIQLRR